MRQFYLREGVAMVEILDNILNNILSYINYLVIINFFIILLLIIMIASMKSKLKNLEKKYKSFTTNAEEKSVEGLLLDSIELSNNISNKNKEIENRLNYLDRNIQKCVQKVGVVRYNAFDNVGSDLSFAIAILDGNDNGVVINGIYSRESSSTYAKAISEGKSKYTLSAEEIQAIDIAKKSSR